MADSNNTRVAVYLDFDNIVISRYNQLFGKGAFGQDRARNHSANAAADDEVDRRLDEARVNIDAVLDYASSFGTVSVTRAYADWSAAANASYERQLVNRAVDLTQLFTTTQGMKNGADIRLSVDAIEDLFQLDDLTHVVIVAGDSDYIALAQRCKRLGRYVIGIGVAGATSRALVFACDEFSDYDDLPGVTRPPPRVRTAKKAKAKAAPEPETDEPEDDTGGDTEAEEAEAPAKKTSRRTRKSAAKKAADEPSPQDDATELLVRAVVNAQSKNEGEWLFSSGLKSQMQRMDPGFKEKALGFKSFADFVDSRSDVVETKSDNDNRQQLRLRSGSR
jgi:hypothetical protein